MADKLGSLENPIVFIGPPASAMRALGDKIASTIVAQSASVPCVDWSGHGITIDTTTHRGAVSVLDTVYSKATVNTAYQGLEHAQRIGFPVMIKASEGGGGKGIRLAHDINHFDSLFHQVQKEVPGSPVFVMKVVSGSRHLEVQLLADTHGNAITLFGRDCSVQRRHQKIIEEAPISVAPQGILKAMEQAAVRLAKLVGYVSAGTVEYLYDPDTQEYFFLELNPRLQVEHPTTEMVSGVNIPAAQLMIAMGIPLSQIKDIRKLYGLSDDCSKDIDFDFVSPESQQLQKQPKARGHVVAVRITAENPDAGFKPNSGKMLELNFRSNANVWGYFSVTSTGGVHDYSDSQFGHVFSYGADRHAARKNAIMALKELSIRADFRTTVEYLITLLENETYVNNHFTTQWLDGLISRSINQPKKQSILMALCGAAAKGHQLFYSGKEAFRNALARGQTPVDDLIATRFSVDFILNQTLYKFDVSITGKSSLLLAINGTFVEVITKKLADNGFLVLIDGKNHIVYIKDEAQSTHLIVDGKSCQLEKEHDPSSLISPSPGKLIRYLVEDGTHIDAGESYAEIEVGSLKSNIHHEGHENVYALGFS